MKIAIHSKLFRTEHKPYVQKLFDCLSKHKAEIYLNKTYHDLIKGEVAVDHFYGLFENYHDFKKLNIDFMISLGGDGTILDTVTIVRDSKVPILGINLGRLGFMAMIEKNQIEIAVDAIFNNSFEIDSRTVLHLESSIPIFGENTFALNDFTILKRDTSSMVIVHTYVNGEFLNSYWADGIIVATPTGSTGYSLSCGGPIIFPKSGNLIITPVAPHNLNVRPIVLSDDSIISFEIEGRAKNFLCTLDSRYETISANFQLAVRKADFSINLLRFTDRNFLFMIQEKLKWGVDSRN